MIRLRRLQSRFGLYEYIDAWSYNPDVLLKFFDNPINMINFINSF